MKDGEHEDCIRKMIEIDGENFYIMIGKNFVDTTVPFENRPDRMKLRQMLDSICDCITEGLQEVNVQSQEE